MHLPAGKAIDTWYIRPLRLIELSDRTDQKVALDLILRRGLCLLATLCSRNPCFPYHIFFVPSGVLDRRVEANVRVYLVLLRYLDEVCKDFFLTRILPRPVAVLSKAVAVKCRPDVATAAGILVVIPIIRLVQVMSWPVDPTLNTMCHQVQRSSRG